MNARPATLSRSATETGQEILERIGAGETADVVIAARKALEANPAEPELLAYVAELETQSPGITPELQISPAQLSDLNPQRRVALATNIFSGAISLMALSALGVLFFGTGRRA